MYKIYFSAKPFRPNRIVNVIVLQTRHDQGPLGCALIRRCPFHELKTNYGHGLFIGSVRIFRSYRFLFKKINRKINWKKQNLFLLRSAPLRGRPSWQSISFWVHVLLREYTYYRFKHRVISYVVECFAFIEITIDDRRRRLAEVPWCLSGKRVIRRFTSVWSALA